MTPIDTIVSIKSGDEYGGKYTGKLGIIKKFTDDRVGVEFAGLKNHASKYGLFWFKKENVTPSLFDAPKRNGECIDILKKHLYQGHAFDSEHMAKELGDVAWYLAISAEAIGYDLETIFQMNIDKLRARYPDGFDAEHSLHRRVNDI